MIVPACFGSFASGVALSHGTAWGLVRHHWVVVKLVVTVISTGLLLLHMQPTGLLAASAPDELVRSDGPLTPVKSQLVFDAAAALAALLVAAALSTFNPKGVTRFGTRWRIG